MSNLPLPRALHRLLACVAWLLLASVPLAALAKERTLGGDVLPPRLFFSDLESGPATGGENDLGAFITLWGEGFGAARGDSTVTIGGIEVARYVAWGQDNALARDLDMVVVQPGPQVRSGEIVITVGGSRSNALPFAVRDGRIYFVAPAAAGADDANPGSAAQPFRSLFRPRAVMRAGDIVYIRGGSFGEIDPTSPSWDTLLILDAETAANGTPERPIAYIGYPGERPSLSNPRARRGILLLTSGPSRDHYVFANLRFTESESPLPLTGTGHRVVGNHLHDGARSDSGAIGVNGDTRQIRILGNLVERNGAAGEKLHHAIYLGGFGTNQDIEIGWNEIRDQRGGRGIQLFGHLRGDRIEDVRIHHNLIIGSELNNVVLGGSDADTEVLGRVEVRHNLIVGSGDPGLRVVDAQGTVDIRHNVLYGNGTPGFDGNAQLYLQRAGPGRITLQNNIIVAAAGQQLTLFGDGVGAGVFAQASNNLMLGGAGCPAWASACIAGDPLFADAAALDFRLRPGSPAIDAGVVGAGLRDYDGIGVPSGLAADIGAHEAVTAVPATFEAQADCLFDWAERQYAALFSPIGSRSERFAPYYYRYYPATRAYVGASTQDLRVYYLGPASAGSLLEVGPLVDWLASAGCPTR